MAFRHSIFYLYVLQLCVGYIAGATENHCPNKCRCNWQKGKVFCSDVSDVPSFSNPEAIKYLDMNGCNLQVLKAHAFRGLVNLEDLDLGNASIVRIEPYAFANLPNVLNIYLQNNELYHLIPQIFSDMPSLKYLDLSKNKLKVFSIKTFENLTGLLYLSLSNNEISHLSAEAFGPLPALDTIYLGNNQLVSIPKDLLSKFPDLTTVHMNSNKIKTVFNYDFSNCKNISHVDLHDNKIHTIEDLAFKNKDNTIAASNLILLTLSLNNLTAIPKALKSLPVLDKLSLDGNHFTTLSPQDFAPAFQTLKDLSITRIKELRQIKPKTFQSLKGLRIINLSSNRNLRSLPVDAFYKLKNLTEIFIQNTSISTFQESLLDWKSLKIIEISLNPINCDCDMQWISNTDGWRFQNAKKMMEQLVCASPSKVANKSVAGLKSTYSGCSESESQYNDTSERLKTAAILSTVVFVCLALCLVGIKYRRTLLNRWRYYRYARQKDDPPFMVENEFSDFPSGKEELRIVEYTDNERSDKSTKAYSDTS